MINHKKKPGYSGTPWLELRLWRGGEITLAGAQVLHWRLAKHGERMGTLVSSVSSTGEGQELKKTVDWWLMANEIEYMIQVVSSGWFNGQMGTWAKTQLVITVMCERIPTFDGHEEKNNQETNIKIIPCVFAQKSLGLVWKSGITMYNPQILILSRNSDF